MRHDFMYLRKSRMDIELDDEIDVLQRHEKQLEELANKKGIFIPEENRYREVVSGESLSNRVEMQKLLQKIENGEVENLFCIEIERLSRGNSIDQGVISQAIVMNKVTVITLQKTYDPNNEYDEEYFEFGLFMSRREYKTINRRLQRGKMQACKEGKFIGSVAPFGYDRVKIKGDKGYTLAPNENATIIKMIFELFLDGMKTTELAKHLTSLGIHSAEHDYWSPSMIRTILHNEVYKGYITWNKRKMVKSLANSKVSVKKPVNHDYFITKGIHKPIISEEDFAKAQELLKSTSTKKVRHGKKLENPLAGILFCGKCGRTMSRKPRNNRVNGKSAFICMNIHCDNVSSLLTVVEDKVIENLKSILKEQKIFLNDYEEEIKKEHKNYSAEIKKINKQIEKLDKQFTNVCEFLEKGIYTSELFEKRTNSINEEKKALESHKNALLDKSKNDDYEVIRKRIPILELCINNYYELEIPQRNELLRAIITRIEYTKEKGGRWKNPSDFNLKIYL